MTYDTMSVHELVGYLVYAPDNLNIHVTCMHDYSKDHDIIESALRKAVVREASVGSVSIRLPIGAPAEIDPPLHMTQDGTHEWHRYDLILKETP